MYGVAGRIDPDTYYELGRATYADMVAAGITAVGEFHYLHHRAVGGRFDDPNAMGLALVAAARDAGLRIALLDTCYLAAGIGRPPEGVQVRFTDGDAQAWADRASALASAAGSGGGMAAGAGVVVGAAIHRCWTPATWPPASAGLRKGCRSGSPTGTRRPGRTGPRRWRPRPAPVTGWPRGPAWWWVPPSTRCAPSP